MKLHFLMEKYVTIYGYSKADACGLSVGCDVAIRFFTKKEMIRGLAAAIRVVLGDMAVCAIGSEETIG